MAALPKTGNQTPSKYNLRYFALLIVFLAVLILPFVAVWKFRKSNETKTWMTIGLVVILGAIGYKAMEDFHP